MKIRWVKSFVMLSVLGSVLWAHEGFEYRIDVRKEGPVRVAIPWEVLDKACPGATNLWVMDPHKINVPFHLEEAFYPPTNTNSPRPNELSTVVEEHTYDDGEARVSVRLPYRNLRIKEIHINKTSLPDPFLLKVGWPQIQWYRGYLGDPQFQYIIDFNYESGIGGTISDAPIARIVPGRQLLFLTEDLKGQPFGVSKVRLYVVPLTITFLAKETGEFSFHITGPCLNKDTNCPPELLSLITKEIPLTPLGSLVPEAKESRGAPAPPLSIRPPMDEATLRGFSRSRAVKVWKEGVQVLSLDTDVMSEAAKNRTDIFLLDKNTEVPFLFDETGPGPFPRLVFRSETRHPLRLVFKNPSPPQRSEIIDPLTMGDLLDEKWHPAFLLPKMSGDKEN
jgi:hypothetical protein